MDDIIPGEGYNLRVVSIEKRDRMSGEGKGRESGRKGRGREQVASGKASKLKDRSEPHCFTKNHSLVLTGAAHDCSRCTRAGRASEPLLQMPETLKRGLQ